MTRATTLWVAVAVCTMGATAGASTVLLSDNFNSDAAKEAAHQLKDFVTTRGSVDVMAPGRLGVTGRGEFLDLDGSTSRAGKLESRQDFALAPGTYVLSFDVAGSRRTFASKTDGMTVSLGDVFSTKISKKYNEAFTSVSFPITVSQATSGHLVFDQAGADHVGLLLDNVSLVQTSALEQNPAPAPVPTPPTTTTPPPPPTDVPSAGPLPTTSGPAAAPVPVPAPPASWTGLAMFGLLALFGRNRRIKRLF